MAEAKAVGPCPWAAAYAVHRASFSPLAADFLSRESFRALASGEAALVLGLPSRKGGKALNGYILCRAIAGEAEVLSLGVRPKARNRGHGKQLISAALAVLRAGGVKKVFLEADPANGAALAAYRALGFRKRGIRKGYYRHKTGEIRDALTMVLPLVN